MNTNILYDKKQESLYILIYKLGKGSFATVWFSIEIKNFYKNIKNGTLNDKKNISCKALKIHNEETAIVGTYTHEVAEQKQLDGTNLARMTGWPLIIKIAPE